MSYDFRVHTAKMYILIEREHTRHLVCTKGKLQQLWEEVIRYSHADWLKRFSEYLQGTYICDLRPTCPHYRLAVYDAVHTVV